MLDRLHPLPVPEIMNEAVFLRFFSQPPWEPEPLTRRGFHERHKFLAKALRGLLRDRYLRRKNTNPLRYVVYSLAGFVLFLVLVGVLSLVR